MLVHRAGFAAQLFEAAEGGAQELGLTEQPFGAAVDLGARRQPSGGEAIEVVQRLLAPPQLVVEVQHLDDESGTEPERWFGAGRGGVAGGAAKQDLAFGLRQQRRRERQRGVQAAIEVGAGDQVRQQQRPAVLRERDVLERAAQFVRGAAGGDEHGHATRRQGVRWSQPRDRGPHGFEIRDPDEAGDAWCDHRKTETNYQLA